jgi:hypothetical protein
MLHFTSVNLHSFISRPVLTSSWFYDFSWDIFSGSRFPSILDMYYFWNSETYTLTESEERTLNQLIYEGLPPRIPLDHVKREVSFVFNDFNNTKKTLQQIKFYSVNLAWHLILLVNCPVTRLQK